MKSSGAPDRTGPTRERDVRGVHVDVTQTRLEQPVAGRERDVVRAGLHEPDPQVAYRFGEHDESTDVDIEATGPGRREDR